MVASFIEISLIAEFVVMTPSEVTFVAATAQRCEELCDLDFAGWLPLFNATAYSAN